MSPFDSALVARATALLQAARTRGWKIATAESCTGGLVAGLLTDIPGSSDVVDRGFVTYSNAAKTQMLGVPADLIRRVGAVSEEVARAMAEGALAHSEAAVTVALTGVAGPGGGSAEKPVGLVHLACAVRIPATTTVVKKLYGDLGRSNVRAASIASALDLLEAALQA